MKYLAIILISILFVFTNAKAEESLSDRYCGFLVQLADQATNDSVKTGGGTKEKLDELMAMANILQKIPPLEKDAIAKHMTFEQFQVFVKNKGLTLSNFYKPIYIGNYARSVCGKIRTESQAEINNGKTTILSKKTTTAEKQFDPSTHPYFNQMNQATQ